MRWLWLVFVPAAVQAESLVATRVIQAGAVVVTEDVTLVAADIPGALRDTAAVIGLSATRIIYPGRPILAQDLAPPSIVKRNSTVILHYRTGGLTISAEGRAMDEGVAGSVIRVMSLASRSVVEATVATDGSVIVGRP